MLVKKVVEGPHEETQLIRRSITPLQRQRQKKEDVEMRGEEHGEALFLTICIRILRR